jgi:cell division protein FtsL
LSWKIKERDWEVKPHSTLPKYTIKHMDILLICIIIVWIAAIPVYIRYLYLTAKKKSLLKERDRLNAKKTNRSK